MADDEYIVEVEAELDRNSVRRVSAELEASLDDVEVNVNVDKDAAIASIREVMTDFAKGGRQAAGEFADSFADATRGQFVNVGRDAGRELEDGLGDDSGNRTGRGFIRGFASSVQQGVEAVSVGFFRALQGGIISNPVTAQLVFGSLLATTPAVASTIGGLLATGIGAGIAGIGIAFAAQSKVVKKAFSDMADDVSSTMRRAAQPLEGVLIHVASEISDVADNLAPSFTRAFDSMTPSLNRFVDKLGAAFSGMGPEIETFTDAFNKQIDGLSKSGGLNDTIEALEKLTKHLEGDELGDFVDKLDSLTANLVEVIDYLEGVGDGLDDLDRAFGKLGEGDLGGFFKQMDDLGSLSITDELEKFRDNISSLFAGTSDAPLSKYFFKPIQELDDNLAKWGEDLGHSLADGFRTGLAALGDLGGFIKGKFLDFIDFVKGIFGISSPSTVFMQIGTDIINGLIQGIQTAWGAVTGFFAALPGRIMGALGNAGSWLLGIGSSMINGLIRGVQSAWTAVTGFFASVPGRITGLLSNAGQWLLGIGGRIVNGLVTGARGAWKAVSGFFSSIPGRITGLLGKAGNLLVKVGGDILRGLGRGARAAWKAVRNFFRDLPDNIRTAVGNLLNLLRRTGGDILRGLWNGARNMWNTVRTWFRNLPENISNAVGKLTNLLTSAGRNALQSLRDGAVDRWERVKGWFDGVKDKIINAVENGAGNLYEAGKGLIGNLAEGIWDGITGPLDRALDSARDKLKALAAMVPGSPIKDGPLVGWNRGMAGRRLMELLADGITAGTPAVTRAIDSAIPSPNLNGVVSLAASTGGMVPDYGSTAGRVLTAPVSNVINQNYYGPTTSGDRLREMTWTLRYATGYRGPQSFEGVR